MTPSPATTAPAARPQLPIPRTALSALDQCRREQSAVTCSSLAAAITHAAFTDGHSETSPSLRYVTRRLLRGVSASAGASRVNYSIALAGLARQLCASGGHRALDQLLLAVHQMYGKNGTFELGYSGAERERALGSLSATAAVVAGMDAGTLSSSAFRKLIGLLRFSVDGDAAKWRLGCAAAHVVRRLLTAVKTDERDSAVRPVWVWCQERRENEDGLQMAFILYDAGLLNKKAFRKLYPSLADGFESALMDTFNSGFSSMGYSAHAAGSGESDDSAYIVPSAWKATVRYFFSSEGAEHLGNVSHFWHSVVLDKLIRGSRSGEKKLLAIELIPLVVAEVNDVETFNRILESSVASSIAVILGGRGGRASTAPLRKNRTSDDVMLHMTRSAKSLGRRLVTQICDKEKGKKGNRPLLRAFLLWSVRGGILNLLLPPPLLSEVLASLHPQDVKVLFSEAVEEFAQPRNEGLDFKNFEDVCNSIRRPNILRFLFALAREHDILAEDAIRIVTLYCIFKQDRHIHTIPEEGRSLMKSKVFEKCSLPTDWCGVLPRLHPTLPLNTAALGFRRLISFLTTHRRNDRRDELLAFCVDLLATFASSKDLCLKLRKHWHVKASVKREQIFFRTQKTAMKAVEKLSQTSDDIEKNSLSQSLRLVAGFLYLYLYDPQSGEDIEGSENSEGGGSEILALFQNINKLAEYIFDAVPPGDYSIRSAIRTNHTGEQEETPPTPVEYIAQLIADLCGRDASSFRHIAVMATEALGRTLDDSVVAVLFDAMESYLSDESVEASFRNSSLDVADDDRVDHGENASDSDESDSGEESQDLEHVQPPKHAEMKEPATSTVPRGTEGDADGREEDADSSSEQEVDVDMDIDSEDPAVLADFDKRLGAHLRLLKQEKKSANQRKLQAETRYMRVSRILDIVEAIARVLRMRLEKSQESDARLPVVFLDLHVRLYELALGDSAKNFRFLKQVCGIVSKQMLLPISIFVEHVSDTETVSEIVDRFLEVLRCCWTDRKVPALEARTISRSAGCLTSVATSLSKGDYSPYLPTYQGLLVNMLLPGPHFWVPGLFNSFLQKAPKLSLTLGPLIAQALDSPETTKNKRQTSSEMLLALSMASCQVDDIKSTEVATFWETVGACLTTHCVGNAAKKWNTEGYSTMVKVAANGLQLGHFDNADEVVSQLKSGLEAASLSHRERARLLKLLKTHSNSQNSKRCAVDAVAGTVTEAQRKKRKTMERK